MAETFAFVTPRGDQVDNYHGELVADPYRWLEDTDSAETRRWIERQNELTQAFLARAPTREAIRARLGEIWDYPKSGVPFERGGRWFQLRNTGLQDQSVLYVTTSPEDEGGRALLDPNVFAPDGTVSVPAMAVSDDGSLIAYATSEAGSDWRIWHVRDVETGADRADTVQWCTYGDASWKKDGSGFYYSATEKPRPGLERTGLVGLERIFFHALGTPQTDDELVFEAPHQPEWLPYVTVSEDGRFVIISISVGTAPGSRIEVLDLERPEAGLQSLVDDFSSLAAVVTTVGTTFFLVTDDGAERRRLVAVDLDDPGRGNWREVVGQKDAVLLGACHCGGRLVCHYLSDACSRLSVFDFEGNAVRDLAVPAIAAVTGDYDEAGVEGRAGSDIVHFELRSFIDPGTLWSHNVATGQTRQVRRTPVAINADNFVSEQVFVPTDDGARVPVFLTRRRDTKPSGDVAVLLYGYGGFNIPITPEFNKADILFVERGGMLAVAVLRGGGEYGRAWYDAGRLANKQRVFDDFCDCARWLVTSGWSRPERIAINGASNGGLLVGACLTEHPELFGAAVPEVGVMDMLRYHKFTRGWAWKSDFGDPDDPEQYQWVRAYSPLHNIKPGVAYPPTFVTTGDHDDRVIPGHSFKFAAALQAAQAPAGAGLALIRVETAAGHGLGKPTSKAIAERADVLAFLDVALERSAPVDAGTTGTLLSAN
jgi:prolyl oligopeptidase